MIKCMDQIQLDTDICCSLDYVHDSQNSLPSTPHFGLMVCLWVLCAIVTSP